MNCLCLTSGYCPVYKRTMSAHMLDICQEKVLTPADCQVYKDHWQQELQRQVQRKPCIYRGDVTREEQHESCCGGEPQPIQIHACQINHECTTGQTPLSPKHPSIHFCLECSDYRE